MRETIYSSKGELMQDHLILRYGTTKWVIRVYLQKNGRYMTEIQASPFRTNPSKRIVSEFRSIPDALAASVHVITSDFPAVIDLPIVHWTRNGMHAYERLDRKELLQPDDTVYRLIWEDVQQVSRDRHILLPSTVTAQIRFTDRLGDSFPDWYDIVSVVLDYKEQDK